MTDSRERQATVLSSVANLCNTIVGAGILGLPYALSHCGLPLGIGLLLGCSLGCCMSLHLLAASAKAVSANRPASFYVVATAAIPRWAWLIDLAVAVKCFGVATSYLIVAGDMMPAVCAHMGMDATLRSRTLWITIALATGGPLACASRLDALKWTSILSIGCVVYLAVLACAMLAEPSLACARDDGLSECRGALREYPDAGALRVLPIFVFGFTCQQNVFSVVNELREPTMARIDAVILLSVAIALALYSVVALSGYLTYGQKVKADILLSYPPDSPWIAAARAALAVVVVLSYPLQAHPSRKCALTLLRALARAAGGHGLGARPKPEVAQQAAFTQTALLSASVPIAEEVVVATLIADDDEAAGRPEASAPAAEGGSLSSAQLAARAAVRAGAPTVVVAPSQPPSTRDSFRSSRTVDALLGASRELSDGGWDDEDDEDEGEAGAVDGYRQRGSLSAARISAAVQTPRQAASAQSHGFKDRGKVYWAYTLCFLAGSYLIAMAVENLGIVMAVVGATGSTAVSYILPGAIYWRLHPHPHLKRTVSGTLFLFGICIVPVSLTAILVRY